MQDTILITGGAGYIGSHANALLNALGSNTIVLDNLIYGHKQALDFHFKDSCLSLLKSNGGGDKQKSAINNPFIEILDSKNLSNLSSQTTFIQADLSDKQTLKRIFTTYDIQAVLHFAAFAYVGESVQNPAKYYQNNVLNSLNLLESMRESHCKNIIFSSTCATYGNPLFTPITESHPQNPINPYGQSKLMVEKIIQDYAKAYGLKYVILRYFNAAGASNFFDIGESHSPETHLIPLVLQAALGRRDSIEVFGDSYDTIDGSCVRDYIHVDDLAMAHILALRHLQNGNDSDIFNLGNNDGFSVLEVIKLASKIANTNIPFSIAKPREGDPAKLIGDASKAKKILGFNPRFYDLESILKSAYLWHKSPRY